MSESVEELNYPIKCVDCGWAGIWANLMFKRIVCPVVVKNFAGEAVMGEEESVEPCCPNCRSIRLE